MKVILNAKSPTRVEILLQPGDELNVSPELGARLLAANQSLQEPPKPKRKPPKPKPRVRKEPTGKGSS